MSRSLSILLPFIAAIVGVSAQAQELPVRDNDFACITQAKADQYVRDFRINVASFGGMELCDSKVDTKKLFNDMQVLEDGKFQADASNNFIRGFLDATNYYGWMRSQTRGIKRGQDVPYATAYNSGGYFTMQDGWAQLSTLGRVGTVVHEARHTEGYRHISCNQGPYMGLWVAGCDRDYNYGGSHAIEMEYYARVSTGGQNFHPVYRKMARLMAMGRSNFVFNQIPLQQKETLMILTGTGRAYLWLNNQWIEREAPAAQGVLKRASFGATLFDGLQAYAIDPYENSGVDWNVRDEYSYYKLLGGDRGLGAGPLRDMEEFDLNRKRYVVGLSGQGQMAFFDFQDATWGRASNAPTGSVRFSTWAPSGANGLFILDQDNKVYTLNPERSGAPTLTQEVWSANTKTYTRTPQGFFRLDQNGHLYVIASGQETEFATPETVAQVTAVPLYDAFEVKP